MPVFPGLSNKFTLTWREDGEEKGVTAPLEVWIAQIVLVLPVNIQTAVMDNVVAEVMRLNELTEEEAVEDIVEEEDESFA